MTTFADIFTLVNAQLDPVLSVPVTSRVPDPRPDSFVQVRRSGGAWNIVIDKPLVDVFCWGLTETVAEALCMQVRSLIHSMKNTVINGVQVYRVEELLGPTQTDDTETGTPQYWMTFSIFVRAE